MLNSPNIVDMLDEKALNTIGQTEKTFSRFGVIIVYNDLPNSL